MIQRLTKPKSIINQICTESKTETNWELAKSITLKLAGLKSWNSRKSNTWKLATTFVYNIFTKNTKPKNIINQICTESKTETDWELAKSITLKLPGLKSCILGQEIHGS